MVTMPDGAQFEMQWKQVKYMNGGHSVVFDPQSPLSKSEVKEIYSILDKRFAEGASGVVTIPKSVILQGSVLAEVSIPALKQNKSVVLSLT